MYYLNTYIEWKQHITEAYLYPEFEKGNHYTNKYNNFLDCEDKITLIKHGYKIYKSYCLMIPFNSHEEYKKMMSILKRVLLPKTYNLVLQSKALMPKIIKEKGFNITILISNFDQVSGLSNFSRRQLKPFRESQNIKDFMYFFDKLETDTEYENNYKKIFITKETSNDRFESYTKRKPKKKRKKEPSLRLF
jgi:hypothetical protein